MNDNGNNGKLDWMYKGATSLVDREEYLLGRSVDKTLEQITAEEKEKKLGIVPPKNHVEHECIPPSIRDFNKIAQADQVDISAKLQEDPLVAIKKREEEARRQFLQNPVQLKKLQEALKAQELKKKKGKSKKVKENSDSDIDSKIAKKLKYLRGDPSATPLLKKKKKKSKDSALDTILMHKFNELKDKLSQEDLNDILAGKVSDSGEDDPKKLKKSKKSSYEATDRKQNKWKERKSKQKHSKSDENLKKSVNKRRDVISDENSGEEKYKSTHKNELDRNKSEHKGKQSSNSYKRKKYRDLETKDSESSSEDSSEFERRKQEYRRDRKNLGDKRRSNHRESLPAKKDHEEKGHNQTKEFNLDQDLENKILEKLRLLRESTKSKRSDSSSDSDGKKRTDAKLTNKNDKGSSDTNGDEQSNSPQHRSRNDRESDEHSPKSKAFGLVKADGTKIALSKKSQEELKASISKKIETVAAKPDRKPVRKLTEEEKETKRREMMKNAKQRDKERSDNLRRYREEDKREEKSAANFDKDFLHKQLLHSTKEATVESRIKSNLNNIQRSSRHMDSHFSRR